MSLENRRAISRLRMEKAADALSDARLLLEMERYNLSANRSYYAVFYAMRAVLALEGIDRKHHSGVISEFRRLYIKSGIFESEMSDIIRELFDLRTDSDYNDFFVASREDVAQQVKNAESFLACVRAYLDTQ